ncbi:MAG: response regulator transcription factor [Deltaproteobacteria bacterium]|nr:response regulator transcription factor [Deltaproteobacteria bacterium]
MNRLLVIDDDVELCELLTEYLTPEGFQVETVHEGEQGAKRALSGEHALVVLDVMLPGVSGFDVLRRIRGGSPIPVLMLTARGDDVDRIVGLEMGADDYLPKPFNPRELVARIRAIQRRTEPKPGEPAEAGSYERIVIGDVELDTGTRGVTRAGKAVDLTSVEFSLLEAFLRGAGKVVTREDLVRKVLGRRLSPYDRSIDVHVSSLRRKLGHHIGKTERIRTVRGIGYLYAHPQGQGEKGPPGK